MPTQPIGWAVVRWFPDSAKPKRLYTGDKYIAERIYNRTKAEMPEGAGRVELLDTRNVVRSEHGYHQDRIPQARNLKTRKAQMLDAIDHSEPVDDTKLEASARPDQVPSKR